LLAQAAEDLEAIEAGQHDVEDYQIHAGLGGLLESARALVLAIHGEALAPQKLAQQGTELRVVVYQQDVHGFNLPPPARPACKDL